MAFRNILVVEDDDGMRHVLTVILTERGYDVISVGDGEAALKTLEKHDFDLVLTDVRMPRMDGLALLREVHRLQPELTVIVMSAYGSMDAAIDAVRAGAYDYISKPFKPDEVVLVLRKAEERERLRRDNERLQGELTRALDLDTLIGDSAPMTELGRQLRKVAGVRSTVLITGESGTGKELVARALHRLSPRARQPFIPVNCAAIPEPLIESELFGHARGAFTGAVRGKKGLFSEADGGTLFLDEIGELPASMQVKLLRVLQESEVRRVGENRAEKIDVRVIAATVRDLPKAVADGSFREDLFYRLDVVGLRMPALRERRGDIPALAAHFVEKYNARLGRRPPVTGIDADALDVLSRYGWPGNVRELENAIERAMVLCEGDRLNAGELRELDRAVGPGRSNLPEDLAELSIKRGTARLEEELIRRALRKTRGNRTRAAELLELSPRALLYKVKDYGIDPDAEGARGEE